MTAVGDTLQAHPPFLSWMEKKTIEYLFFEASRSAPIFEGNAHEPICARLEEELQLAVNITEWAKFKTEVLMVRRCGPGGICVAVTGRPSQMRPLSTSKASLSFIFFSSHPSPPAAWVYFYMKKRRFTNCGSAMWLMPWQRWPLEVGQKSLSCGGTVRFMFPLEIKERQS